MYTRVPDKKTSKPRDISIPENYGGSAFMQNRSYQSIFQNTETPKEIYEVKEVEKEASTPNIDLPPEPEVPIQEINEIKQSDTPKEESVKKESPIPSLIPFATPKLLKNHFPFGHGIGSEELLILGIMTLLFMSDEDDTSDGELIMLLALLLFAG